MGAVIKINLFLASRVEQLFQYDKDEGPLVVFPAEKGTAPQPTTKERKEQQPKAKQTRFTTKGRKVKPGAQPGEPSTQQTEAARSLTGWGSPDLGHAWVKGHQSKDQLTIRCQTCGLYMEQTEP